MMIPADIMIKNILNRYDNVIIILGIIVLGIFLRYGLLDIPLERDEGEYAYAGQLILNGEMPYKNLYSMKFPGVYAAYAMIFTLFGQTHTDIHFALLIINLSTAILIYYLTKKILDSSSGITASLSFIILSVNPEVQGVLANSEHFVILPVVAGILLLVSAIETDKKKLFIASGFLIGIGFIMKQHGFAFVLFGCIYILFNQIFKHHAGPKKSITNNTIFLFSAILPLSFICGIFALYGSFDDFWFWTVEYSFSYVSLVPIKIAWNNFIYSAFPIISTMPLIFSIAGFGLLSIFWNKHSRKNTAFLLLFTLFSFLSICPGFYFRRHYFILILPMISILTGFGIKALVDIIPNKKKSLKRAYSILLIMMCLIHSVYMNKNFLFEMTPFQASRFIYGWNPFPESLEIAKYINKHTGINDKVAVIGSEPQIYFYSKRQSASGYVYMYPLMETHRYALKMQEDMTREIEAAAPKILVFINVGTSWLKHPDSHVLVFKWFNTYSKSNYDLSGIIEIFKDKTKYNWGPNFKQKIRSDLYIAIFKRKRVEIPGG